ncbi:probable serine/threonine-protein kinase DDB_G0271682 [Pocillopora damicornis]|uniref:probable serine/threonine-protein kinase DDB_G0271682 n=1 Tax=Pocillopora damicornis TaxID=46731 RepID=UPI000F54FC8F|nr:probable serine/threonine-protein kinase DDB_G0271682 [Pocillopora damicornis]
MGNISSIEEIEFGDKIGEGSYGEVWKAVWKGKQAAAKRILPILVDLDDSQREAILAKFKQEWEILCSIQHENIVQYYTVIHPPSPESPIIVTELLECDLAKHIRNSTTKPKVPFSDIIKIMLDVAEGLHYIHTLKKPIVHRDLASKNVLLTKQLHAKIADLGQAKAFPRGAMYATAMPGTPVYAAPETYPTGLGGLPRGDKARYSVKIDIFSFGAMLLEIIIGHLPVGNLPDPVLEDGEIVPEYIRRHEDLEEMGPSHPLRNLVLQCLKNSPEERPSAGEIKEELSKAVSETLSDSPSDVRDVVKSIDHYDHKFKLVVLGETGVGKTSIVTRFLDTNNADKEILFTDQKLTQTVIHHFLNLLEALQECNSTPLPKQSDTTYARLRKAQSRKRINKDKTAAIQDGARRTVTSQFLVE